MKKLQKILLINWLYFGKECIDVGDINFLTGKNAAGKSTIIDALQIVLLGELNERNFNKAASDKSARTLNGYLRADMDTESAKSRVGKEFASYIACEFYDDIEQNSFVLGIVFQSYADGNRDEKFFHYNGVFPENQFVENKNPMDISTLRKHMGAIPKSKFEMPNTQKEYRKNILAKLNIHNEQFFRMMKRAVSFSPIDDIQKFITENICDVPQKPAIEEMQANIRDYKRHEELAQRQEEKMSVLVQICDAFREYNINFEKLKEQKFVILYAEKEVLITEINKLEYDINAYKTSLSKQNEELLRIKDSIQSKSSTKEQFTKDLARDEAYQERERLEQKIKELQNEEKNLVEMLDVACNDLKKDVIRLQLVCKRINNIEDEKILIKLSEISEMILKNISCFVECDMKIFSHNISVFSKMSDLKIKLETVVKDINYQLNQSISELKIEYNENEEILKKLSKNIKDYPEGLIALKKELEQELTKQGCNDVQINVLADVLEIKNGEETWRGAVEGYLNTQKFYLLITPRYYAKALQLYNQIKHNFGDKSFGLVDIEKLREKENIKVMDDSLACKLETNDEFAKSYIDYLLGRVICCTSLAQLRQNKIAITADGMLYQGYVSRPLSRKRMEDSFIGRNAIDLRIARLKDKQKEIEKQIKSNNDLLGTLISDTFESGIFSKRYIQKEVPAWMNDFSRINEIEKEIVVLENKSDACDLSWADTLQEQIKLLQNEINELESQKTECNQYIGVLNEKLRNCENDELPKKQQDCLTKTSEIEESYSTEYKETIGVPRYKKEWQRLNKNANQVVRNFTNNRNQSANTVDTSKNKLFDLRKQYARDFQPCSFNIFTLENDEFENERYRLQDSELPKYRDKIKHAKESALEQFQNDFLAKLRGNILSVKKQITDLNDALKQAQFGTDKYQFRVDKNPDFRDYYDMILSAEFESSDGGLFSMGFQQKYATLAEELFSKITDSDDTVFNVRKQSELQKNIDLYTDFRTYLKFDLETTDQNGSIQMLSQTLNKKSGGETQTPFYIAVLASFAQLYRVNDLSNFTGNTMRLVMFDEAFNKMDSERIIESVRLLRKMELQAIICTPPDKIPDIMPEADKTLYVHKHAYNMNIIPYTKEMQLT